MMLILTLGRLDVLPIDDYGVRNGVSNATGREVVVTPKELKQLGLQWSPLSQRCRPVFLVRVEHHLNRSMKECLQVICRGNPDVIF